MNRYKSVFRLAILSLLFLLFLLSLLSLLSAFSVFVHSFLSDEIESFGLSHGNDRDFVFD